MMTIAVVVLAVLHAFVCLALWRIDERLEKLEQVAHPPVDVRTVARAYARSEAKRVLAEAREQ